MDRIIIDRKNFTLGTTIVVVKESVVIEKVQVLDEDMIATLCKLIDRHDSIAEVAVLSFCLSEGEKIISLIKQSSHEQFDNLMFYVI